MANSHIPLLWKNSTRYNTFYGEWLKEYKWTYILTLRKHIPLTEEACRKIAQNLIRYSDRIANVFMALERDRGDNMNHLHIILETGDLKFTRKEMVEALSINKYPKTLSYFAPVVSSDAVSMYCAKRISVGSRLLFHDFYSQRNSEQLK